MLFLVCPLWRPIDDETGRPPLAQSKEETNETLYFFFAIFSLCFFLLKLLYHKLLSSYIARVRGNEKFERSKEEQQQEAGPRNGRIQSDKYRAN